MFPAIRLGLAACLLATPSLFASVVNATVPNSGDIYSAGQTGGTALEVLGLALTAGGQLQFNVSGVVGGAGCSSSTPDGCLTFLSHDPGTGLARYQGPAQALVGVFLDDSTPSGSTPATYVASPGASTFNPGLLQIFFIGDGRDAGNNLQSFVIPTGATRIFLGISDNPGYFNDNTGSFRVSVNDGMSAEANLLAPVPEPSTYALIGMALMGLVLRRRKNQ